MLMYSSLAICASVRDQPIERFQFDSRSGPPYGAWNSQASGAYEEDGGQPGNDPSRYSQ
jgi:hypothetical protein